MQDPSIPQLLEEIDSHAQRKAVSDRIRHLRTILTNAATLLQSLDDEVPAQLNNMQLRHLEGMLETLKDVQTDLKGHLNSASTAQQQLKLIHYDHHPSTSD